MTTIVAPQLNAKYIYHQKITVLSTEYVAVVSIVTINFAES
jgi:hypothetical protein